jgi:hypothetical protein
MSNALIAPFSVTWSVPCRSICAADVMSFPRKPSAAPEGLRVVILGDIGTVKVIVTVASIGVKNVLYDVSPLVLAAFARG